MRVAALYDVHGNLPALDAVLEDVRRAGVDRVVVGGDVLPGPMPREALDRLLQLDPPPTFIRGNGDRETLAEGAGRASEFPESIREVLRWNAVQLDAAHRRAVAAWPLTVRLVIPGLGDVLFCHATPRNDNDIVTAAMPDEVLGPMFEGAADVVVCGHTHMQFDRHVGVTRIVNAGSIGMPFQAAGAYWLRLGPDVEFRRVDYDLDAAAVRVRATGYPQAEDFARNNILQPPLEADMLNRMTQAGLAQWQAERASS